MTAFYVNDKFADSVEYSKFTACMCVCVRVLKKFMANGMCQTTDPKFMFE